MSARWLTIHQQLDEHRIPRDLTQRLKVPGGWLYRVTKDNGSNSNWDGPDESTAFVFVPEPESYSPDPALEDEQGAARGSIPGALAQIEWRPPKGDDPGSVRVFERRFIDGRPAWSRADHDEWPMSDGACWTYWSTARGWMMLALILEVHNRLLVDYRLDPELVEREFSKIREYSAFMDRGMESRVAGVMR